MQGLMVESHEKHDEWMKERMAGFTHGQTQEDVLAGASDHTDAQFVHEALEFKKLNDPSPYSAAGGNDSTREEPPEDELDGSEEGEPPAEQAEEEEDPFERLARLQAGTSSISAQPAVTTAAANSGPGQLFSAPTLRMLPAELLGGGGQQPAQQRRRCCSLRLFVALAYKRIYYRRLPSRLTVAMGDGSRRPSIVLPPPDIVETAAAQPLPPSLITQPTFPDPPSDLLSSSSPNSPFQAVCGSTASSRSTQERVIESPEAVQGECPYLRTSYRLLPKVSTALALQYADHPSSSLLPPFLTTARRKRRRWKWWRWTRLMVTVQRRQEAGGLQPCRQLKR